MRKLKLAYILAFAPLLLGADATDSITQGLTVNSLPKCQDNEYLTYAGEGKTLVCTAIMGGSVSVPNCSDQLLTYTSSGDTDSFQCTGKGLESLSSSDITTINTTYQTLQNLNTTIISIETNPRAAAAKYCGQTGSTNGAITSGGVTGLAGAADLCSKVAACGTGARMCSVYDMFASVANGTITSSQTVTKAWVYMAAWRNFGQTGQQEATAGMNDNCGAYTYPTSDRHWQGTAVKWENAATGQRSLKFYTGLDNPAGFAGQEGAPCNTPLPVACCK